MIAQIGAFLPGDSLSPADNFRWAQQQQQVGLIRTPANSKWWRELLSFLTGLTLFSLRDSRQVGGTSQEDPDTEIPVLGSAFYPHRPKTLHLDARHLAAQWYQKWHHPLKCPAQEDFCPLLTDIRWSAGTGKVDPDISVVQLVKFFLPFRLEHLFPYLETNKQTKSLFGGYS